MMTLEEKALELEKLTDNEEFLAAYHKVESKNDLQQLFVQQGVELESEEIDAFVSALNGNNEELDADARDSVAGGVDPLTVFKWAWNVVKKTGKWAWEKGKQLANWEDNR